MLWLLRRGPQARGEAPFTRPQSAAPRCPSHRATTPCNPFRVTWLPLCLWVGRIGASRARRVANKALATGKAAAEETPGPLLSFALLSTAVAHAQSLGPRENLGPNFLSPQLAGGRATGDGHLSFNHPWKPCWQRRGGKGGCWDTGPSASSSRPHGLQPELDLPHHAFHRGFGSCFLAFYLGSLIIEEKHPQDSGLYRVHGQPFFCLWSHCGWGSSLPVPSSGPLNQPPGVPCALLPSSALNPSSGCCHLFLPSPPQRSVPGLFLCPQNVRASALSHIPATSQSVPP